MKKTLTIKRAILRRTLNLLGVCTVGLMAACAKYGVEISTFTMNLMGTVKSNDSLKTIENIEVSASNSFTGLAAYTDGKGEFSVNIELEEGDNQAHMKIADIDGSLNGSFITKDTVLTLSQGEIESGTKYGIEIQLKRDE